MNAFNLFSIFSLLSLSLPICTSGASPKFLVLVVSSVDHPTFHSLLFSWHALADARKENFDVYFLLNDPLFEPHETRVAGRFFIRGGTSTYIPGILDNTMAALKHFLNTSEPYDFVIRTNLSSFFFWDRILAYFEDVSPVGFLGGYPVNDFLSGCGLFMSYDVAKEVEKVGYSCGSGTYDDVLLGCIFRSLNLTFTKMPPYLQPDETGKYEEVPDTTLHIRNKLGSRLVWDGERLVGGPPNWEQNQRSREETERWDKLEANSFWSLIQRYYHNSSDRR